MKTKMGKYTKKRKHSNISNQQQDKSSSSLGETKISHEEQHLIESDEKYNRLLHIATKAIRREAKVVKTFECQKIVRKIKSLKDEGGDIDEKVLKKIEKLELKLKFTKEFDLENLVPIALTRIGFKNTEKNIEKNKKAVNDESEMSGEVKENLHKNESETECVLKQESKSNDDIESTLHDNKEIKNIIPTKSLLVETILSHKRLSTAMNTMIEKVSEYNTWVARREEWLENRKLGIKPKREVDNNNNNNKAKKRNKIDASGHDGKSGLFIDSLSGIPDESMNFENDDMDNEYYDNEENIEKKKNRMGQRARKAKAQAIEAKKSGKDVNNSINWRQKKSKDKSSSSHRDDGNKNSSQAKNHISASGLNVDKEVKASDVATMGKSWKEDGHAHPSWAARQAQKASSGIVEFKGKKITFD